MIRALAASILLLGGVGAASVQAAGVSPSGVCEVRLSDARTGRGLMRLQLPSQDPHIRIAFEHSVLGTTVIDRYRFTPKPVLVEEEFEGDGYGLPAAAGPGERLETQGGRKRLLLSRTVDPLIVRALQDQRMRLLLPEGEMLLSSLGASAVLFEAEGCAVRAP